MDRHRAEKLLAEKAPGAVRGVEAFRGETTLNVAADRLRDVMKCLRECGEGHYDLLVDLAGIDCGSGSHRFRIAYLLHSTKFNDRLRVKIAVADGGAVDTVSDIWKAADWLEREVYDLFGIPFRNHPDLRRILLPDGFDGHPLRKDYPLKGPDFAKRFSVQLPEEETRPDA